MAIGNWTPSCPAEVKACAATFIERKTRLYQAVLMLDRKAASMEAALQSVAVRYPKGNLSNR